MGGAEAGHLQRVAHAAAGFQGQILDVGIHVVVGHQHGIAFVQQGRNAFFQRPGLIGAQGIGHLGPGLPDAAGRGGGLRVGQVIVENPVQDFHHRRDPPRWGRGYGLCGTAGRLRVGGGGAGMSAGCYFMLSLSITGRNSGIDRNPCRVRTGHNGGSDGAMRARPSVPGASRRAPHTRLLASETACRTAWTREPSDPRRHAYAQVEHNRGVSLFLSNDHPSGQVEFS